MAAAAAGVTHRLHRGWQDSTAEQFSIESALGYAVRLPGYPGGPICNVGCGYAPMTGAVNVDLVRLPTTDVVCDAGQALPFRDEQFAMVVSKDVLEHVDLGLSMREVCRVLAPGGVLVARVPHFTSRNVWVDPTHRRGFSCRTFDFFCQDDGIGGYGSRNYYYDFHFSARAVAWVEFRKAPSQPWNRAIEGMLNRSMRHLDMWEHTALSRLFPGHNVVAVLQK